VAQKPAFTRHKHQVRYLTMNNAIHKPTVDYCKNHIKILIWD